jgi:hypothetical protein
MQASAEDTQASAFSTTPPQTRVGCWNDALPSASYVPDAHTAVGEPNTIRWDAPDPTLVQVWEVNGVVEVGVPVQV